MAAQLVERLKADAKSKADPDWISFNQAEDELAKAFGLSNDVASMTLFGLIATGLLPAADTSRRLIDLDTTTIVELDHKPAFVSEGDLRHWLRDQSDVPTNKLDLVIKKFLRSGKAPWRG